MRMLKYLSLFILILIINTLPVHTQSLNELKGYDVFYWGMELNEFLSKAQNKYEQIKKMEDSGYGFIDYMVNLKDGATITFRFMDSLSSITLVVEDEKAFNIYFNKLKKLYGKPNYKKNIYTDNWIWNGTYTIIEAIKTDVNTYSFFYTEK